MVAVHDDRGVLQRGHGGIVLTDPDQVLVMIVGMGLATVVHIAAQDGMGKRIARAFHFPVAVDEILGGLGRLDGIHHHGQVAAGGVLHAHGDVEPAGGQPVLLVLHAPGTHGHIGQQIGEEEVVLRIEHLIRAGESRLIERPHVQVPDGDQPLEDVRVRQGIGLVEHALVADARGARLVGIDARNDDELVFDGILDGAQAVDIVDHRIFVVRRTGADDEDHFVRAAGQDVLDLAVILFLAGAALRGNRIHLLDFPRLEELAFQGHIHSCLNYLSK